MYIRVLGAVLIVIGLYSVLWGKYREYKDKEAEEIPEPMKGINGNNKMGAIDEDIEANIVECEKHQVHQMTLPEIAISSPMPNPPMLAKAAPKA